MKVEFNRRDNVVLIRFVSDVVAAMRGGHTYTVGDPHANGMINLEFDRKGRLVEIEVMDATKTLPAELLSRAERV